LSRHVIASLGVVLWLLVAGCGSSQPDLLVQQPSGPPLAPATGTIEVQHVLARAVTTFVTDFQYSGLTPDGTVVYGPVARPKEARSVLEGVPLTVSTLRIDYLSGGIVIGRYRASVDLLAGGVVTLNDPAWLDVGPPVPAFTAAPSLTTGNGPVVVTAGDLNLDGHSDLVVCNSTDDTLSIFLGRGNGEFVVSDAVPVGDSPFHAVVADINGDGRPDLVVSNYGRPGESSGDLSLALGRGDGTFEAATNMLAQDQPIAADVADFTGDGIPDLVVCNYESTSVSFFRGLGDGIFAAPQNLTVGARPHDVLAADLNRDGKLDLVVANEGLAQGGGDVCTLLGDGQGGFAPPAFFATGRNPRNAEVADLDGDGLLDVVTANFTDGNCSVLLGRGDGTLQPSREFDTGGVPLSIVAGDFNGDGRPDLAAACAGIDQAVVLPGMGDGSFTTPRAFTVGDMAFYLDKGDFNEDGRLDLAVVGFGSNGEAGSLTVLLSR
jgi:hypothetical protein